MNDNLSNEDVRCKKIVELEEFTNAVLCISVISKSLIEELFRKHKELNIPITQNERIAWKKVKDGAASLDHIVFNTGKDNYNKFKKSVLMVKFLLLELISRCDDSDIRVWQFHNLLKSYKVVYPSLIQTLDDEQKAFADLFGQTDK